MKKCLIRYELEYPSSYEELLLRARAWEDRNDYCYGEDVNGLIGDFVLNEETLTHNETPEVIEIED